MQILSIEDLYRLRDCEVKELLKNNETFKVGGYVWYSNKIFKIIAISKNRICVKSNMHSSFDTLYLDNSVKLLTYKLYKFLCNKKNEDKFENVSQKLLDSIILKKAIEIYGVDNKTWQC